MKDELTFEQILDMLQGGARNFIGDAGIMGFGTSAEKRAGKVAGDNFLTNIMGGNTTTNPTTTTDDLSPVNMRSMVNTNNASGTDPMMMIDPAVMAGVGARGLNTAAEQKFLQETMGSGVRNLGIGVDGNTETYGFTGDTLTPEAMNGFRAREGITALTADEQNYVNFLEQTQPEMVEVFLQGLRDGNYEMEMQPRLTQGFR